ncbi:4-hydroxy-tetrahydrodipicolinate synthase [Humibacter antri]
MIELVCAPITPFGEDGELDVPGTRVLFEAIGASGVHAVFTPGTTGEFTALDDGERMAVIECALDVFGADGVYAHVGAATARQAVEIARAAYGLGATRLAAITPFYQTAGPVAVADYYQQLTTAVPQAEFYVYVFPARATTTVSPLELAALAGIPGIVGAKISGLSTVQVIEYIRSVPAGFRVLAGNDVDLVRLAAAGGAGVVSGVCGVFPEPFVAAAAALNAGEDASSFQPAIDRAVESVGAGDIRLLKASAAMRGLPAGPSRVALDPPTEAQLAALRRELAG